MPINQSFSWWCFANRGVETDALLAGAKKIGLAAAELVPPDNFQQVIDSGLKIASHPVQGISKGFNDAREHDRLEREVKESLELAVKFGISNLIVFSGERVTEPNDLQALRTCATGLKRVAKAAEGAGVYLCMELLNSKINHKHYQCDRTDWGMVLCDIVESDRVKLLYDIYHMQIMEGDIIRTIRNNHAYFSHYHTAGNPGRNDLDETQEIYYPPIMKEILATGYTGYVGHEFIPKGPDPLAALEAAFKLCDVS